MICLPKSTKEKNKKRGIKFVRQKKNSNCRVDLKPLSISPPPLMLKGLDGNDARYQWIQATIVVLWHLFALSCSRRRSDS